MGVYLWEPDALRYIRENRGELLRGWSRKTYSRTYRHRAVQCVRIDGTLHVLQPCHENPPI
ncbi:hypothetical protein [Ralstonia phage RpY2]|uniref:Uncharacterized protein n=1 Tax=Ralstonia phage RpY2 TaxID=2880950 RepID=A0AC61TND2_9CAUD|nr:hypothetical protein [Ralstonia phage RpY2]